MAAAGEAAPAGVWKFILIGIKYEIEQGNGRRSGVGACC